MFQSCAMIVASQLIVRRKKGQNSLENNSIVSTLVDLRSCTYVIDLGKKSGGKNAAGLALARNSSSFLLDPQDG
jgi:hypothetical protein